MKDALYPMISFIGPILGLVITHPRKKVFKKKEFQLDIEYAKQEYFPFLKDFLNIPQDEKNFAGKLWIDQIGIGLKCNIEHVYIRFINAQSWYLESGNHGRVKTQVYDIPLTKTSLISALETIKNKRTFLS